MTKRFKITFLPFFFFYLSSPCSAPCLLCWWCFNAMVVLVVVRRGASLVVSCGRWLQQRVPVACLLPRLPLVHMVAVGVPIGANHGAARRQSMDSGHQRGSPASKHHWRSNAANQEGQRWKKKEGKNIISSYFSMSFTKIIDVLVFRYQKLYI